MKKDKLLLSERTYICSEYGLEIDRDLNASINIHNQLPIAFLEVKPVEITALNLENFLLDLTSIVETGRKHQTYAKRAGQKITSAPSKIVPLLGVATVITMTTLEIKDMLLRYERIRSFK